MQNSECGTKKPVPGVALDQAGTSNRRISACGVGSIPRSRFRILHRSSSAGEQCGARPAAFGRQVLLIPHSSF
jgi:hypothetical protein